MLVNSGAVSGSLSAIVSVLLRWSAHRLAPFVFPLSSLIHSRVYVGDVMVAGCMIRSLFRICSVIQSWTLIRIELWPPMEAVTVNLCLPKNLCRRWSSSPKVSRGQVKPCQQIVHVFWNLAPSERVWSQNSSRTFCDACLADGKHFVINVVWRHKGRERV